MWGRLLDAAYPRACAGCGDGPWPFCPSCASALCPIDPPWCDRCGAPSPQPVRTCEQCPPASVTTSRAVFAYEGAAKQAVHRLKFGRWRDVAGALAAAVATLPSSAGRRRHVGAARPWPKGRARVRSGACAGRGARPPRRRARDATAAAAGRDAAPSNPVRRRAARRDAGRVRRGRTPAGPCPPGRRRVDHRRHRGRSRRRAVPGRCVGGARSGRCALRSSPIAPAGAVCLSSGGRTSGSVVARGRSPVVDASRGRNDPRKATVGG